MFRQTAHLRTLAILALCVSVTGCATQRGWRYSIDSYPAPKVPLLSKSVVVPPFKDSRPDENTNAVMLYLIPLMPFGWADYSQPESGNMKLTSVPVWQFSPREDMAKAAAEELNATGFFKEVFFSPRSSEGELVFRGDLKSTRYWGKLITYGLSAYGPLLWFLGLPAGTIHNELAVEFRLEEPGTAQPLWQMSCHENYEEAPFWFYNLARDFDYDNLFKTCMKKAIASLQSELSKGKP